MEKEKPTPITIKVPAAYLTKLDNWRRKQSPIPSRSEAIRTLTASGLQKQLPGSYCK